MLKRLISLVLIIILSFSMMCLISACNKEPPEDYDSTNSLSNISTNTIATTNPIIEHQSANKETDVGGGVITVQKYRHKFYSVPGPFVDYVDRDSYYEWLLTIDHTATAETMVIKQFIQHFGITREQFDKANLECARRIQNQLGGKPCINPKDYANQEDDEVYNAEVIFTFDDNLIREYYLSPDYPYIFDFEYEEAVANSEYTSKTEKWIDIEQMEAEIIEKYGEAEIVIETTPAEEASTAAEDTAIPEETIA